MSIKRQATTDLNHDNWDKEQPADHEEMGTFKSASREVLEKRVIKTAKRRSNLSSGDKGNSSVFSGFGGFNRAQPSSFDFLADLTNGANTNGGPITSTKGDSTVSSSFFSGKPIASTGIGNSVFSTSVMFGANKTSTNTASTTQATPFSFISSTQQPTTTGSVFTTTKADSTVEESVFKNQSMSTFSSNQTGFSFNPPTSKVTSTVFGAPSSNAKTSTVFGASSSNATTVFGMPPTSAISSNMFGVPSTTVKTSTPFGTPTTTTMTSPVAAVQSSANQSTTFGTLTTIAMTSSSAKTSTFGAPTAFAMTSPMSLQSSAKTSSTFGMSSTNSMTSPEDAVQSSANTTTFVVPAAIGLTSPVSAMQSSATTSSTFKMPTTIIKSSSTFGSPTTTAMGSSGITTQHITKTSPTFGGHSTAKSSVFGVPPSGAIMADAISTREQTSTVSTSANKSAAMQSSKSEKTKHNTPDKQDDKPIPSSNAKQDKVFNPDKAKLRYHNKLRSLNKCVSEWINKHIEESPCCILSPVFKDYNDYLKEIKDEYHASSNNTNQPCDNESVTQDLNENKSSSKHLQEMKEGQLREKPSAFPKPDSQSKKHPYASSNQDDHLNKKPKQDVQFNKQTSSHLKQNTQSSIKLPASPFTQPSAGSIFTNMGSSSTSVFGDNKPNISSSTTFTPPSTMNTPFGIKNTSMSPSFSFNVKTPFQANVTTTSANSVFSSNPLQNPTTSTPFSFGTGKPFSFNTNIEKKPENQDEEAGNDEDTPPKVEFTQIVEENSVYDKKCKIFVRKDGNFVDNGVGTLYIKKIEETGKHQLLVRANTSLGTILINLILVQAIPIQRMGKNNVMMMCIPTPEAKPPPTPILIRVKTSEEADQLLETLNKYKT